MDDNQIVELFLTRNEDAIKFSSEKYGKRLFKISFGIVNNYQTAEECENDTYVEVWNSIPPHKPYTYLYAFLARIVRHLSLNRLKHDNSLKRSQHLVELSDELIECIPDEYSIEDYNDSEEFMKLVNKYLLSIDVNKRVIFARRYFYLDSVASISKRYLISESKVKTTLYRVRIGLREFLVKEGYFL